MKNVLLTFVLATLVLFGCKKDEKSTPKWDGTSLQGNITEDVTLDADVAYTLDGTVRVQDGATLTIPAGTTIKAKKGFSQYVIVERGSKIKAQGTAAMPITFTSGEASPAAGDWGGLIINGYAPISGQTAGTEAGTEVDNSLLYGGTDAEDNSGILDYVILAYTGARSSSDVEHNGLTLNAVGSGTKISNIYVPYTADDGVEFFGGTVSINNMLVVDPDDDMFDVTQGWQGSLNNGYGIWQPGYVSSESDPRGVESDGNFDGLGPDHVGQSNYSMSNISIINNSDYVMEDGIKVRRGATASFTNLLIKNGTTKDLIDLTDSKGDGNVATMIRATKKSVIVNGSDIKQPAAGSADVALVEGNTGADISVFGWTGYEFDDSESPIWEGSTLSGDVTSSVSLDPQVEYTLDGTLSVKEGATLIIPQGTTIKATKGFASYVIVERGGKIKANGTADKPIEFTSAAASPAAGDWGGLIINGYAPISGQTAGTEGATEVDNALKYGGTNAEDNSGILNYVILAYTGARSSSDVEHNGLTLNAVGSGTQISNIYVPYTADDGVEFFGGTVSITNMLVVDEDDDMFDVTQGWKGTLDNAYGIWTAGYTSSESDPRGVEADGNFDGLGPDHVGQSDFIIKNITIVNNSTYVMEDGIKIRRGATANITNALLLNGTTKGILDLTDSKGDATVATVISATATNVTSTGDEIKMPAAGDANATLTAGNAGADTSVFSWTGFEF